MGIINKQQLSLMLAGTLLMTGTVDAARNAHYDHARVVSVDPIHKTVRVNQPRQECWYETVSVPQGYYNGNGKQHVSRTPEIFGAIVGSAVGHQFGSGRGQDIATVAGAILGGSIGHDIKNRGHRKHHRQRYETREEKRCETVNEVVYKERIQGYRVTYRYHGHLYTTRMQNHPGKRIKVKVKIKPVS